MAPARIVLLSTEDARLAAALSAQANAAGVHLVHAPFNQLLELARARGASAVLVDLQQRVDGRLLVNLLKQDKRTAEIPVVVVADAVDDQVRAFCASHRVAAVDVKPASPYLVRKAVRAGEAAPPVHPLRTSVAAIAQCGT